MPSLRLSFAGLPDAPALHLSVDGMTPIGPNLSHWPGNRTPVEWKADLSTGICLRFARAERKARERFLQDAEAVLNDHYDTDGFLSLLTVLRPEVALAREELCLLAAATGDFQAFQTRKSFAIDRVVLNLAHPQRSPMAAQFSGLEGPALSFARYRWLIENAETVLDRPATFAPLYEDDLARLLDELGRCKQGALQRTLHHRSGLSVLRSEEGLQRATLNTLAAAWRVLHIVGGATGTLYRYHDRTESWFELVTIQPPPRRDLAPLAAALQDLEGAAGEGRWCADRPEDPVPELYHGIPAGQAYGEVTRTLTPSRLDPSVVERLFVEYLAEQAPR
jgi:hypothetical protein